MADPLIKLDRWFARQRGIIGRQQLLHSVIFGAGLWRYLFHRTRFMLATSLLRMTLHISEFILLIYLLPTVLYPAMIYRLLSLMVDSAWWGLTDPMRHRIRQLRQQQDKQAIQREISGWLTLACLLGMIVTALYCLAAWRYSGAYWPFGLLLVAMGVQTGVRLVCRTFYSAAFSVRRVFLPVELIAGPEILIFALGILLKSYLGDWGPAICVLLSASMVGAISYRYVRDVTDYLRITPQRFLSLKNAQALFAHHRLRQWGMAALASLGIRMHDVVLVGGLQWASQREPFAQKLFFAMYLVMPLLRSCRNWSQTMYFDLSKYHLDIYAGFRSTLEHAGFGYSLVISLVYAAASIVVLGLFFAGSLEEVAWVIVPYMIISASLGFVLISLFARQDYRSVVWLCLLHYGLLLPLLARSSDMPAVPALMLSLILPLCFGWGKLQRAWAPPVEKLLPYISWRHHAPKLANTHEVVSLRFHPGAPRRVLRQVARQFSLQPGCYACVHEGMVKAAFSRNARPDDRALLAMGGGYVTVIGRQEPAEISPGEPLTLQELSAVFSRIFPAGTMQVPMRHTPSALQAGDYFSVLQQARQRLENQKPESGQAWYVTAGYRHPHIVALFMVPGAKTSPAACDAWRQAIDKFNFSQVT